MTLQTELLEIGKEKLTRMKALLDDLEVQMSLGKSEAKDILDRERRNFLKYVGEQKEQFRKMSEKTATNRTELLGKLEALTVLVNKDAAGTKRAFDLEKKEILPAIYELEVVIKETFGDFSLSVQSRLSTFKEKLDAFRIRYALCEFEELSALEGVRADLKAAMKELSLKLRNESKAGEVIDRFSSEMGESYDHLKKAFNVLLS
jgi:hypothetical protein